MSSLDSVFQMGGEARMRAADQESCRKPGQRKENYDDESSAEILKKMKALFRKDFGGKNIAEQIAKQMKEEGVDCGPKSLEAIEKVLDRQIDGIRKRCFPRIDEVIRRAEEKESVVEKLP